MIPVVPPLRANKPTKVVTNKGKFPHAIPLLFAGPNAQPSGSPGTGVDSGVAGGLTNALLNDALQRDAGIGDLFNTLGGLSEIGPKRGDGSSATSITYVNIIVPPHGPTTGLPGTDDRTTTSGTTFGGSAMNLTTDSMGNAPFIGAGQSWGQGRLGNWGVIDQTTGARYDRTGQLTFDPRTGTVSSGGQTMR